MSWCASRRGSLREPEGGSWGGNAAPLLVSAALRFPTRCAPPPCAEARPRGAVRPLDTHTPPRRGRRRRRLAGARYGINVLPASQPPPPPLLPRPLHGRVVKAPIGGGVFSLLLGSFVHSRCPPTQCELVGCDGHGDDNNSSSSSGNGSGSGESGSGSVVVNRQPSPSSIHANRPTGPVSAPPSLRAPGRGVGGGGGLGLIIRTRPRHES